MCKFPKSEGMGFSKEDLSHIANLWKTFKAQKTLLCLCVLMVQHHKELAKPIYKDIDDQFRQMLIKVKTTEMATSDLEKYYHALNKYAQLPSPLQRR